MKVLYLNTYDTTFIQNQIVDLKNIGKIEAFLIVHLSYWHYLKDKKCKIDNVFSKNQHKSLSNNEKSLVLSWGLPKNYLFQYEPFFTVKKILRQFKNVKFNLIHAQNGFPSGYVAMLLSQKWKIPYMITSHGMDTYRCFPNSYELGESYPFSAKVVKCFKEAMSNADCVAGVSHDFSAFLNKISPEIEVTSTPNSYNYKLFKKIKNNNFRKELNIPDDEFIILATGYFIKRKAHEDIIQAVSLLEKYNSKMKIVIIGGGPLEKYLIDLAKHLNISDKLVLINNIPQASLVKWYNIANVFVFPSLYEPFGLGLVEAMACGTPAIATYTWGPNEIIEHGVNGLLVNKKSPSEIADNIKYLYENQEERKVMGNKAAKSVFQKYAKKNYDLLEIYKQVIARYESK